MSRAKRFCPNLRYQEPLNVIEDIFEQEMNITFNPHIKKIAVCTAMCRRVLDMDDWFNIFSRTSQIIQNKPKEKAANWIRNMTKIVKALRPVYGFVNTIWVVLDMLEKCFLLNISDSHLVVDLLKMLNDTGICCCLRNFILSYSRHFRIHPSSIPNDLNPEERCNILSYYLQHGKSRRETFKGKWFRKRSYQHVFYCIVQDDVKLVMTLLQNGFCSSFSGSQQNLEPKTRYPSFAQLCSFRRGLREWCRRSDVTLHTKEVTIIETLLLHIFDVKEDERGLNDFFSCPEIQVEMVYRSLPVLFRALPIPLSRIPINIADVIRTENGSSCELKYEVEDEPCSLMQLSRCAIRRRLADNFMLPEGIQKLGIPSVLCNYINLEF